MKSKLLREVERLRVEGDISDPVAISLRGEYMEDLSDTKNLLSSMVYEWEKKMDDNDPSLYSLGLRHAIEKIDELLDRDGVAV